MTPEHESAPVSGNAGEYPAGRELDTRIAERVMGWRHCADPKHGPECDYWWTNATESSKPGGCTGRAFSTDIADVWEVLDKVTDWRTTVSFGDYYGDKQPIRGEAEFRCAEVNITDGDGIMHTGEGTGPTIQAAAALAICRAALKAIGHDRF